MYLLVDKDGQPLEIYDRLWKVVSSIKQHLIKSRLDVLGPNITVYKQKSDSLEKNVITIEDLKKMYLAGVDLKLNRKDYSNFVKQNKIKPYTLESEFLDIGYRTSNYDLAQAL